MSTRDREFAFGAWADCFGPGFFSFGARSRRRGFRIFDRGDLKYIILRLLAEKPMHGYEVMRALQEESCGVYSASPGSVYPTLQMLEDLGYVVAEERDGKKVYSITDAGREFLDENGDVVDDIVDRVTEFTDRLFGDEMRDLTRSFRRLARTAFETAMRRSDDPEALLEMKEILDRAAREIQEAGASPTAGPA